MKTLIYIASDDRSGSTLLEYLLSNNEQICSLGELHNLSDHIHKTGHGEQWYWKCSCGRDLEICPFWSSVKHECASLTGKPLSSAVTRYSSGRKIRIAFMQALIVFIIPFKKLKIRLLNLFYDNKKAMDAIFDSIEIIDCVAKVTKKNIIIESSKVAHRLYGYLSAADSRYAIKVIHLVRDARAVSYSKVKRAHDRGRQMNFSVAMLYWIYRQIEIINLKALIPKEDYICIRYEDVCKMPVESMRYVCDYFRIPYDPKMTTLNRDDKHSIGGSTRRFEESTEIVLDERWKLAMNMQRRVVYSLSAWPLDKIINFSIKSKKNDPELQT